MITYIKKTNRPILRMKCVYVEGMYTCNKTYCESKVIGPRWARLLRADVHRNV